MVKLKIVILIYSKINILVRYFDFPPDLRRVDLKAYYFKSEYRIIFNYIIIIKILKVIIIINRAD